MSEGRNISGIVQSRRTGCTNSTNHAQHRRNAATSNAPIPSGGLWERQVAAWKLLGPPLRPGPEDVAHYASSLAQWSHEHGVPRGLILGVTPELAALDWPPGSELVAVDRCQVMVERVWPGFPKRGEGGICADWSDLPIAEGSRDIALGDGSFTQLDYPHGYRRVLRSIHRVLGENGIATFRFFVKPDKAESPENVLADLWQRRIGSFHAFKWRLAMSLQTNVEEGISLGTIWSYWADALNPNELAARLGWSPQVVATMENYRRLKTRYSFPTLAELRKVLSPEFIEVHRHWPRYELGERCAILTLNRAS